MAKKPVYYNDTIESDDWMHQLSGYADELALHEKIAKPTRLKHGTHDQTTHGNWAKGHVLQLGTRMMTQLEQAIEKRVENIRRKREEYGYVLAGDGSETDLLYTGDTDQIKINPTDWHILRDLTSPEQKAVFLHNHPLTLKERSGLETENKDTGGPDGIPFSANDAMFAEAAGIGEMRVVSNNTEFTLRPKIGKSWPTRAKIGAAYKKSFAKAFQRHAKLIFSGRDNTIILGNVRVQHAVWADIAPKLGLEYTFRILSPDKKKELRFKHYAGLHDQTTHGNWAVDVEVAPAVKVLLDGKTFIADTYAQIAENGVTDKEVPLMGRPWLISPSGKLFASKDPWAIHGDIFKAIARYAPEEFNLNEAETNFIRQEIESTFDSTLERFTDRMIGKGWTRIRLTQSKRELNVNTNDISTATLRKIQRLYDRGKLPTFERLQWDGTDGSYIMDIRLGTFLSAKQVIGTHGFSDNLKEYRLVTRLKHLEGTEHDHDQQTHGIRGGMTRLGKRIQDYMQSRGWERTSKNGFFASTFIASDGRMYGGNSNAAQHPTMAAAVLSAVHVPFKSEYDAIDTLIDNGFVRLHVSTMNPAQVHIVAQARKVSNEQRQTLAKVYRIMAKQWSSTNPPYFILEEKRGAYNSFLDFMQGKPPRKRARKETRRKNVKPARSQVPARWRNNAGHFPELSPASSKLQTELRSGMTALWRKRP